MSFLSPISWYIGGILHHLTHTGEDDDSEENEDELARGARFLGVAGESCSYSKAVISSYSSL